MYNNDDDGGGDDNWIGFATMQTLK